jgi:dTMP kinase
MKRMKMSESSQKYARGTLFVFEGGDGCGKTTVAKMLKAKLEKEFPNVPVHYQQNPDGQIRELLLNRKGVIPSNAELLMFAAGHLVLMENTIKPALTRGEIVILDRYYLTTMAYQGYGRQNLPLTKLVLDEVIEEQPDMFFFVSANLEVSMERLKSRGAMNFMDQEKADFHQRTIEGFEALSNNPRIVNGPFRIARLANNGTLDDVDFTLSALIDDWVRIAPDQAPGGIGDHVRGLSRPPVAFEETLVRVIENGEVVGQATGELSVGAPVEVVKDLYCEQQPDGQKSLTFVTESSQCKLDVRAMAQRFMGWSLPRGFSPDCGISFDGRKDDEFNKNKTWPIGTNLFSVEQAEGMLNYVLSGADVCAREGDTIESIKANLKELNAQLDEHKELVARLHSDKAHPDFQYADSDTMYSSSDDVSPPPGEGWEPNFIDGRVWTRYGGEVAYHFRRPKSCKQRDPVDPFDIPNVSISKVTGTDLRSLMHEAQLHGRIAGQLMKSEGRQPLYTGEDHRGDYDNGFYILQPSTEIPDVHLLMNIDNLRFLLGREYTDIMISARNPAGVWSNWVMWGEKASVAINPLEVIRQTRTFLNSLD